jgi:geranylgeranyl reductase
MNQYDIIIVGAGPAGLMCAEVLSKSDFSVLVLEKNSIFGDKVCAGGLTRKDLALLDIPDEIIEHKITRTAIFSRKRKSSTNAPEAFVFTVNRITFGTWQKNRLNGTKVEVRTNAKVNRIEKNKLIVNNEEELAFKYLVGADGYFSVVRKYLKLPQEKRLIGIQYSIPENAEPPQLEIHLNHKRFFSWYGWKFPHKNSYVVGSVVDPQKVPIPKMKSNFSKWLNETGIDISKAKYSSFPISYDYRGLRFGNIFLSGEAAGLASGFTGEGIYQSLVSGQTVAHIILDKNYKPKEMESVLKYNAIQKRILNILLKSGPFKAWIHELIVILLNNKWVKAKIHNSFS